MTDPLWPLKYASSRSPGQVASMSEQEARALVRRFMRLFPKVHEWLEQVRRKT